MSPAARALAKMISWYQLAHADRPSPCRYVPSCSTYAAEAVETRGAVVGSWLTVRRLLRCHPWGSHGYDPVPPARTSRRDLPHERTEQRV